MAPRTMAKLGAVLALAFLLGGCAGGKRKAWEAPRWYESDMSSDDRSFFLGSFLNPGQ